MHEHIRACAMQRAHHCGADSPCAARDQDDLVA
jgi:hypothetical protein